jgi:hypothetical protein
LVQQFENEKKKKCVKGLGQLLKRGVGKCAYPAAVEPVDCFGPSAEAQVPPPQGVHLLAERSLRLRVAAVAPER